MKALLFMLSMLVSPLAFAADVSLAGLVSFIIYLVIVGLILWCIWWFIGYVGLPEPFNKVARVVVGLIALILVVNLLLGLIGTPFLRLS